MFFPGQILNFDKMEFETIHTERLTLRKLTPEILAFIYENYEKEEIKIMLGLDTDEDYTRDRNKSLGGYTTYRSTMIQFKIVDNESGLVIGAAGFHNWYAEHSRAELGYIITKEEFKNKGIMTEAVSAILEYGFTTMNLERVEAYTSPSNEPSIKLLKKFNFTQEGYMRKRYFYDGKFEDSPVFGLLKEEYKSI